MATYMNPNAVKDPETAEEIKASLDSGGGGTNGTSNSKTLPALCRSAEDFVHHDYDFIVCGGGTAGLTIAARLSELANVAVGVLEAGPNNLDDPLVDTPALFTQMLSNPAYDWKYRTTPQEGFRHLGGLVRHHLVRGKMLGGSSAINYMLYVRGNDSDYDTWAALAGDESWNGRNLQKYFLKHQTLEPKDPAVQACEAMSTNPEDHGSDGPVHISFNDFTTPIDDAFLKSTRLVTGEPETKAPYGGDHIGPHHNLGTVSRSGPHRGKRSYAARAYFEPNASRPNLHVLCDALVHRVELDGDAAVAVTFEHAGEMHTVRIKKEIIVSGGAVGSPQILELSGIGDPAALRKAGVECKVENDAVGRNFMDHLMTIVGWKMRPGWSTWDSLYQPEVMAAAQKLLVEKQGGPLTGFSSVQAFFSYKKFADEEELARVLEAIKKEPGETDFQRKVFAQIAESIEDERSPNIQVVHVPVSAHWDAGPEDQSALFSPPEDPSGPNSSLASLNLQYPFSRGFVHVKSADPHEHPDIDPAFGKHPADIPALAVAMKVLDRIGAEGPFGEAVDYRIQPPANLKLQGPGTLQTRIDEIRNFCTSEYHPCGSVAMGDALDSRLKVKGVKALRVADASIFPSHVSGNIQSSVYAIAEKAADMIKEDWGL